MAALGFGPQGAVQRVHSSLSHTTHDASVGGSKVVATHHRPPARRTTPSGGGGTFGPALVKLSTAVAGQQQAAEAPKQALGWRDPNGLRGAPSGEAPSVFVVPPTLLTPDRATAAGDNAGVPTLADLIRASASKATAPDRQSQQRLAATPRDADGASSASSSYISALEASLAAQVAENERQGATLERLVLMLAEARQQQHVPPPQPAVHSASMDALLESLAVTRCLLVEAERDARQLAQRDFLRGLESLGRLSVERQLLVGFASITRRMMAAAAVEASFAWTLALADRRLHRAPPATICRVDDDLAPDAFYVEELATLWTALEASRRQAIEQREAFCFATSIIMPQREATLRDSAAVLLETLETQELTICDLRAEVEARQSAAASLSLAPADAVTPRREPTLPPLAPLSSSATPRMVTAGMAADGSPRSPSQMSRAELLELVAQLLDQNSELVDSLIQHHAKLAAHADTDAVGHDGAHCGPVEEESAADPTPESLNVKPQPSSPPHVPAVQAFVRGAGASVPTRSPPASPPRYHGNWVPPQAAVSNERGISSASPHQTGSSGVEGHACGDAAECDRTPPAPLDVRGAATLIDSSQHDHDTNTNTTTNAEVTSPSEDADVTSTQRHDVPVSSYQERFAGAGAGAALEQSSVLGTPDGDDDATSYGDDDFDATPIPHEELTAEPQPRAEPYWSPDQFDSQRTAPQHHQRFLRDVGADLDDDDGYE